MSSVVRSGLAGLLLIATVETAHAEERMTAADVVKVAPEAGRPTVGKWKPTWCDEVGEGSWGWRGLVRNLDTDHWSKRFDIPKFTCVDPANEAYQQQVGHYMQAWVNWTGASPKQVAALFTMFTDEAKFTALAEETCKRLAPIEEGSDGAKALRSLESSVLGCSPFGDDTTPAHLGHRYGSATDNLWALDVGPELPSQLLTVGRLLSCLPAADPSNPQLAGWAFCRLDRVQLDPGKLKAELTADGHNALALLYADLAVAYIDARATELDARLMAVAKDPDVKAMLIDAPARGWKAWMDDYAQRRAAVDAAIAYEKKFYGLRKSEAKGCFAGLEMLMPSLLAGKKITAVDEALAAAGEGVTPILLNHLLTCATAELPNDHSSGIPVTSALASVLAWGQIGKGPRIAAMAEMSKASATIAADRTGFPFGPDAVSHSTRNPLVYSQGNREPHRGDASGEVKTVKVVGDQVEVTFKAVKFKEPERSCEETSKVIMWANDGRPIYERKCRYTGRTTVIDMTARPFATYKHFAAGIKPGVVVKYNEGVPGHGFPVEVWSKDGKTLIAVMGMAVKP